MTQSEMGPLDRFFFEEGKFIYKRMHLFKGELLQDKTYKAGCVLRSACPSPCLITCGDVREGPNLITFFFVFVFLVEGGIEDPNTRVDIKPGFYHKAQPGGFYRFYEGRFLGFYGFYVGFINLKVYH